MPARVRMDPNYSALPKNSFIELQLHNEPNPSANSINSQARLTPIDQPDQFSTGVEKGSRLTTKRDIDDENYYLNDFDIAEYPLVASASPTKGSNLYGAIFNLATSIIGAGIMALPATMKVLGLGLGTILIVLMGILSEFSIELLVKFAVLVKANTYGEVVQSALGKRARIISEMCIIVSNAGVLVVYLIIIGDVMSGSLHHSGVFDQWLGKGIWDNRKLLILIVVVIFLAPLCVLEKIDSLSMTSAASVALAIVFVVVCFSVALIKLAEGKLEVPRLTPDIASKKAVLDLLVVIPIMTNAYVCHFNVHPIYNELKGKSPQKMNIVGRITTLLCVVVYAATAISGYMLFGKETEADVLTNFDKDLGIRFSAPLNLLVRVGYVVHLILVFPVVHFSLRETAGEVIFREKNGVERKKRVILTFVLLGLIYFGSTMVPNIWTAFKFTGATCAVALGFIFPSLIALRLGHLVDKFRRNERALIWFMLVFAVVVGIVGIIGNIYSLQE